MSAAPNVESALTAICARCNRPRAWVIYLTAFAFSTSPTFSPAPIAAISSRSSAPTSSKSKRRAAVISRSLAGRNARAQSRQDGRFFSCAERRQALDRAQLKSEADKARLFDLVATADVLVENYRPGVMERLGLGYERLTQVRCDLIYCAISGFGQTGRLRTIRRTTRSSKGYPASRASPVRRRPRRCEFGYPVCDTLGGLFGAFAISSALVRRSQTGEGAFRRRVDAGVDFERARLAGVELSDLRACSRARWATKT